ncbi:MAG: hypothetical protein JWM53_1795 [bacterium]|nr:hypothetical protein [bacterium]
MQSSGRLSFSAVKVFSATLQRDRDYLGERITEWLAANRSVVIVDVIVTQSSDRSFHCVSITLFYKGEA